MGRPRGPANGKEKAHVNIRTDADIVAKWKAYCKIVSSYDGQKRVFDNFVNSLPEVKG